MTGSESVALAVTLSLAGLGLAAGAFRSARRRTPAAARFGVALAVLAASAIALEPWAARREAWAVDVGGATELRRAPLIRAEAVGSVEAGSAVQVDRRFGDWARVRTVDGTDGWIEGARLSPLT
jgi:hypothetical protein